MKPLESQRWMEFEPVAGCRKEAEKWATIDATGLYRYELGRVWADGVVANFVMLNPSTADATHDDPTIKRCIDYAKRWKCGGLVVTNLFAYRSTDPSILAGVEDPVGRMNDEVIAKNASGALVVLAWGNGGGYQGRGAKVAHLLGGMGKIHALSLTRNGQPNHPLRLLASLKPFLVKVDGAMLVRDGSDQSPT